MQLDPYSVLGVSRSADSDAIKAAYRKAAKKHHPDAGGEAARMAEATLAYDVLMDAGRRRKFDETGRIEDEPMDPKVAAANQLLFDMLAQVLMHDNNPFAFDLVTGMEQHVTKQAATLQQKVTVLERALDRTIRMEKRFTRKAKKKQPNVFAEMLKLHQKQIGDAVTVTKAQIETHQTALEILREYAFTPDGMNNFAIRYAYTVGTGGSITSILV